MTGFLASAALVALLVGTTYAISRYAGTVGALPSDGLRALGLLTLRVTAAATLAGLVGASLGALTRHTGAAIAVALGYAVAIEGFVRAWKPELAPFLVDPNLNAWIGGQSTYYVATCGRSRGSRSRRWRRACSSGRGAGAVRRSARCRWRRW